MLSQARSGIGADFWSGREVGRGSSRDVRPHFWVIYHHEHLSLPEMGVAKYISGVIDRPGGDASSIEHVDYFRPGFIGHPALDNGLEKISMSGATGPIGAARVVTQVGAANGSGQTLPDDVIGDIEGDVTIPALEGSARPQVLRMTRLGSCPVTE